MVKNTRFALILLVVIVLVAGCDIFGGDIFGGGSVPDTPYGVQVFLDNNVPKIIFAVSDTDNVDGVYIERALGPDGNYSQIKDLSMPSTDYYDYDAEPDNTYSYRVAAYNDNGTSQWSTSAEITVVSESEIEVRDIADNLIPNDASGSSIYMGTYTLNESGATVNLQIKNAGTSTLKINSNVDVSPSGSIDCSLSNLELAPDSTGSLQVTVKTDVTGNPVTATATIHSNDATDPDFILYFYWYVS